MAKLNWLCVRFQTLELAFSKRRAMNENMVLNSDSKSLI